MTNTQKFLHYVYDEVGYVGRFEFTFAPQVKVICNISDKRGECYLSVVEGDEIMLGDAAIDRLDEIDRNKAFTLPTVIMQYARRSIG